ncbi:MAG: hypothetical protein D6705_09590 [Deltaproteobacteria bacterium]|nr:MAG: hypothetical protein D6705_09590 [Deltaproteobacteria bacterium]
MTDAPPDVAELAALARLRVPADDAERLQREIATVIAYVAAVRTAEGAGERDTQPVRLDPDEPEPVLERDAALAAAPDPAPPFFGVPTFVDDA